ncbi:MAG: hypothetical protein LAQ69_47455 [Acidobacteriia bacterium]|nr:hypothetical protein [Terriglobia bacterium]
MALDKIKFSTNVPIECALKFPEGKLCDSQFGDPQYMFSTTDDRVFFVAAKVAQKIHGLRLAPGELFDICKEEVAYGGGRKGIEWKVAKVGGPPEEQPAHSAGQRAARKFWGGVGEQPDGTFAVPAPPNGGPERVIPTPAPVAAASNQPPSSSHANGNNNWGQGTTDRPKTKLEDALKTVVAAVHSTNEYAKSIGYAMPRFTSEDLRTMANTLMIGAKNGGSNAAQPLHPVPPPPALCGFPGRFPCLKLPSSSPSCPPIWISSPTRN